MARYLNNIYNKVVCHSIYNQIHRIMEIKKYMTSAFRRPIFNHKPCGEISLFGVYRYEVSSRAVETQNKLRAMTDEKAQKAFKDRNFDWVTPAGTFSYASDDRQLTASETVCMDLDYLCLPSEIDEENGDPVSELKEKLLKDPYFDTLLLFRSPRGRGLKWWVPVDLSKCDHRTWFTAIRNYVIMTYHLSEVQCDGQVINESRGCLLGHDSHCYLKPELFEYLIK